ncbi:MAG: 50S rRNA methyltransferase, partial [Oscillospiraceae bacterium]|nr:50S rRNA methyltransferase [Oscillospiraceae bacterium]
DYITASSFHLPIADHSADLILSLFAPAPAEEFRRILASGGHVLQVVPGAEHLWELKQAVYDKPYANREEKHLLEGFLLQERRRLAARAQWNSPELIQALFAMTPYSHHTPAQGLERLRRLKELNVTISFLLMIYRAAN